MDHHVLPWILLGLGLGLGWFGTFVWIWGFDLFVLFAELGMEPRASYTSGMGSATELPAHLLFTLIHTHSHAPLPQSCSCVPRLILSAELQPCI
jgi:hypothetical protein